MMRTLPLLALGAAVVALIAVPSAGQEERAALATGQVLVCDGFLPTRCTVRCSSAGTEFFVSTDVQRAFLLSFGGHTLLQLQESAFRGDITSVLISAVTHCTLDGLRDPALLDDRGLFPEP